jgi:hypothetical protein
MSDRRSPRSMIVSPPRAGDAVGVALRNVYRNSDPCPNEWDLYVTRIDQVDRARRN